MPLWQYTKQCQGWPTCRVPNTSASSLAPNYQMIRSSTHLSKFTSFTSTIQIAKQDNLFYCIKIHGNRYWQVKFRTSLQRFLY